MSTKKKSARKKAIAKRKTKPSEYSVLKQHLDETASNPKALINIYKKLIKGNYSVFNIKLPAFHAGYLAAEISAFVTKVYGSGETDGTTSSGPAGGGATPVSYDPPGSDGFTENEDPMFSFSLARNVKRKTK